MPSADWNDADRANAVIQGQAMHDSGAPFEQARQAGRYHARGWIIGAQETQRVIARHGPLLRNIGAVKRALTGALSAIQMLAPSKLPPAHQRRQIDSVRTDITTAVAFCEPELPAVRDARTTHCH